MASRLEKTSALQPAELFLERAMCYAYILQSVSHPEQFYRGCSSDLRRRLAEHNAGKSPHTSKFMPWRVKFYAAFDTTELAQEFERYLKSSSGHAFAKKRFGL
jgi:predicted GIY-YIG superfamily endonuclease